MKITILNKNYSPQSFLNHYGIILGFLNPDDSDSATVQINKNYQHGGGWHSFKGFTFDPITLNVQYPGDPVMKPIAEVEFREERVLFYENAWVLVLSKWGEWEISRID